MWSNRQKMHDADAERARQNLPEPTGLWRVPGTCNAHNAPRQKSQEPALPIGAGQGKVELAACDRHESDASAGRGGAMWVATLAMVRGGGLAKRHERAAKSASALDCAAAHGSGTSLLGRRATGTTPTRRPKGVLPTGTGRRVAR